MCHDGHAIEWRCVSEADIVSRPSGSDTTSAALTGNAAVGRVTSQFEAAELAPVWRTSALASTRSGRSNPSVKES
jgi:hypothetical protein